MPPLEHATTQMAGDPACAEHEGSKQSPMTHHGDAADDASAHSDGEHDCCKSGDCECPCLHVPCAALDAAVMNPVAITLLRIPHGVRCRLIAAPLQAVPTSRLILLADVC